MGVNNYGREQIALLIGGSGLTPEWCAIGSGSGTFMNTVGSLYAEVLSERRTFTTRDLGTAKQVSLRFDFGANTMSGTFLREFGVGTGSTVGVQDLYSDTHFAAVEFDGTNELQIEIVYEVF